MLTAADFEGEEGREEEAAPDCVRREAESAHKLDRKWFAELRTFIGERIPVQSEGAYATVRDLTPAVADAEERAVVAALRAVEVIASRFAPKPAFTLDVRDAGRDH